MSIFKAYDVRGKYPSEIDEAVAFKIAKAFVSFLGKRKIAVGRDVRLSSDSLFQAVVNGLIEAGADVYDIGICTTDMFYFAVFEHRLDGGLMITASHNPKEYNGIKIVREKAIPVAEESGLTEVQKIFESEKFITPKQKGKVIRVDIKEDYVDFVQKFVRVGNIAPLKVVLDASNGAASLIVPRIFQNLRCESVYINFTPDGNFPGHGPNPLLPQVKEQLSKIVLKEKADIGIIWDSDADRCLLIDDGGKFVQPDFVAGILAEKMLLDRPKSKIVYDVRSSHFVKNIVRKMGGKPIISKGGHTKIKAVMREEKAFFGGEASGHYYYKYDDFYADNGIIPAIQILEVLSVQNTSLSKLLEKTKGYCLSGELNYEIKGDINKIIAEVKKEFKNCKFSYLDGITVVGKNFWFNIRPSNTEPLIRLNVESSELKIVRDVVNKVSRLLK
ncbi:MAG TPA: phosphomannomutase/phosphoglucomutase [Candidatus Nanoarchaeia archaeon]|nr:phosphomannomutase/phosphoglucomutase [Candidatus Nanoarchaeia archaeon]